MSVKKAHFSSIYIAKWRIVDWYDFCNIYSVDCSPLKGEMLNRGLDVGLPIR